MFFLWLVTLKEATHTLSLTLFSLPPNCVSVAVDQTSFVLRSNHRVFSLWVFELQTCSLRRVQLVYGEKKSVFVLLSSLLWAWHKRSLFPWCQCSCVNMSAELRDGCFLSNSCTVTALCICCMLIICLWNLCSSSFFLQLPESARRMSFTARMATVFAASGTVTETTIVATTVMNSVVGTYT